MGCGCSSLSSGNCGEASGTIKIYKNRATSLYNRTVEPNEKQRLRDIIQELNRYISESICPSEEVLDMYKNMLY